MIKKVKMCSYCFKFSEKYFCNCGCKLFYTKIFLDDYGNIYPVENSILYREGNE